MMKNPYIDKFTHHDTKIPRFSLDEYWKEMSKPFDKVVNLSGSVEGSCLATQGHKEFNWSKEEIAKKFDKNYYENQIKRAEYEPILPIKGELYFSKFEERLARQYLNKFNGKFKVMWVLSGSGMHKAYPWWEYVALGWAKTHPDTVFFATGDIFCNIMVEKHPQIINKCENQNMRTVLALVQYMDLVVGPETGLLNAAACYDHVPKIVMLSHSSEENLTKHWTNCVPLYAVDCECYPCHKLIYDHEKGCGELGITGASGCMQKIHPNRIVEVMNKYYGEWYEKKTGKTNAQISYAI